MHLTTEIWDRTAIEEMGGEVFKRKVKNAFDASIPWDNPQYDLHFLQHYLDHTDVVVALSDKNGKQIALSIAFFEEFNGHPILYIAGIWVSCEWQGKGVGKKLADEVIHAGMSKLSELNKSVVRYIALRTQNSKLYEYFFNRYDLYPRIGKNIPKDIRLVCGYIHRKYSPSRIYEEDFACIRKLYDPGFVIGHYHRCRNEEINEFFSHNLNILDGDCFILTMAYP